MNILALASIVVLASFALLYFAAALVARRSHTSAPDAGRLFARAVWPTLVPAFVAALVLLPSFLWHEAPQQDEWPGALLVLLALAGGARLGVNLIRAIRTLVASRALVRAWQRGSTPLPHEPWGLRASKIDTGFPVVAVAGLFTPHVFVDRRVLDACSPAELAAVAAHERAHVAARDNLRRLMIAACAGLASDTAVAWRAAAERAADERAVRTPGAAAELASALVRVARAAPPPMLPIAAVSTIDDGGSLDVRVRRLLAFTPGERQLDARTWPLAAGACAALAGLMLATPLPKALHGGLELLVQYLF